MAIPKQIWDKLCEEAKQELIEVLTAFETQYPEASGAFELDVADFIMELLADDEQHFLERWCD